MDSGLKRAIEQKVRAGERLTSDDGVALHDCDDLAWLGGLAHEVRTAKHGEAVLFAPSRHLNVTIADLDEAVRLAAELAPEDIAELHVVIELDPAAPWADYPRALRALREALPGVALKAFTATEIHRFEQNYGRSADEILDELIDAGLQSFADDDTEIADWEDWSRIHRRAHAKGLKTSATGTADDLLRLRELQDETGGFQVFVPRPGGETPAESLTAFAAARLLLDNVPHVKSLWDEVSVAQLSLNFGVDELDGQAEEMSKDELLDLIRDAGFTPVERNARYEVLREYEGPTPLAERRREPQPMWS